MLISTRHERWQAAAPFLVTGGAAVIGGGLLAAAIARAPAQSLVWTVAYLVLVVGVAQALFGGGQAWLARDLPHASTVTWQWLAFNLGNLGVIVGTIGRSQTLVAVGTVLFVIGVALFLLRTRHAEHGGWLLGYRAVLSLLFISSLVGLALSFHGQRV
ncbi:MAG TPA: hypothetical protein VFQ88_12210 [Nevskiaceae bacterium]|nr:hypothetical protein [Nevskiaceae bacterium]